jgi:methionyl-tRNA synthetase
MLRYYLTQIAPETKDSEFTWKGFQDAVNSELGSIFGNFVNRSFVLMHKLCKGKVPPLHNDLLDEVDQQLIAQIKQAAERTSELLEAYKFREALYEVIDLSRKGNQYMQKKEPWIRAKETDENGNIKLEAQQAIDNCMHLCLQLTANLSILIHPFLPNTARTMLHMMKVVDKMLEWKNAGQIKLLSVGYSLREPQLLFRKIEDTEIAAQIEKLKAGLVASQQQQAAKPAPEKEPAAEKASIQYDDFAKLDLRVGTITQAEKIKGADKLLKLEVDLGFEKRTIVSGIALHFAAEAIVGRQVVVVCNLAPRKMRGVESRGMILMAEDAGGKLKFINPDEATDNGSIVS